MTRGSSSEVVLGGGFLGGGGGGGGGGSLSEYLYERWGGLKKIMMKNVVGLATKMSPRNLLAPTTGSWDLGQISSTMESTQSSARSPSRLTYKEASGMAATLSMLEDIGALHAALKISAENDKDQLL